TRSSAPASEPVAAKQAPRRRPASATMLIPLKELRRRPAWPAKLQTIRAHLTVRARWCLMPRWVMRQEVFWAAGIFAAIVVVAALVNKLRPTHRTQVRRLVILFALHVVALGVVHACNAAGHVVWGSRMIVVAELLQAFTIVNLAGTAIFSVLLPATGVVLPMIASDLLVGLGCVVATLGVLSTHGLNLTGALASAAVVSAVLAISLQSTLGNILGGIALQLDGSIHEGDWIQLENGRQGRVRAVRWRHTVVETRDWSTIIVPNALLLANNIMILGKRDGREVPQRYWVWFNVDFRYAPTKVIDVVL